MSIKEMIAEHPNVAGKVNDALDETVRHAMYCAAICNSCADACLAEDDAAARAQCIRLCTDCADICTATFRVATRRTGENDQVLTSLLHLCVEACEACAAMCEKHGDLHCNRCATMCRETAEDCRKAIATL